MSLVVKTKIFRV